jgi:hypothetical protein
MMYANQDLLFSPLPWNTSKNNVIAKADAA